MNQNQFDDNNNKSQCNFMLIYVSHEGENQENHDRNS
jgi:hypothetical protein